MKKLKKLISFTLLNHLDEKTTTLVDRSCQHSRLYPLQSIGIEHIKQFNCQKQEIVASRTQLS